MTASPESVPCILQCSLNSEHQIISHQNCPILKYSWSCIPLEKLWNLGKVNQNNAYQWSPFGLVWQGVSQKGCFVFYGLLAYCMIMVDHRASFTLPHPNFVLYQVGEYSTDCFRLTEPLVVAAHRIDMITSQLASPSIVDIFKFPKMPLFIAWFRFQKFIILFCVLERGKGEC